MAADLSLPVRVVGCPTVREPDGLALSSRKRLPERSRGGPRPPCCTAPSARGAALVEAGETDAAAIEAEMAVRDRRGAAGADSTMSPRCRPPTLTADGPLRGDVRLLAAVRFGKARLIDNLGCRAG